MKMTMLMRCAMLLTLSLFVALLVIPARAQKEATLPADTKASVLKWTGHAEVGTYSPSGTLLLREGRFQFAGTQFRGARFIIDMASMAQENSDLLHHLKSADFFDVEHFPTATIAIDRLANKTAFGSLTIRGKTTPFETPVQISEEADRFIVTGKVSLDRTKYGIVYNSTSFFSGLGNKAIRNDFDVEFNVVGMGKLPRYWRP